MKVAHVSDIHAEDSDFELDRLRDLVREIIHQNPDVCVISGDLTDHGKSGEIETLRRPLNHLSSHVPTLATLGNHDSGWNGIWFTQSAHDRTEQFIHSISPWKAKENPPYHFDKGGYRFIGIDTTYPLKVDRWSLARGRVGPSQRDAVKRIAEPTDLRPVLVLHHHPFARGFGLELKDSAKFMAELFPLVHAVMFGHKHTRERWGNMFAAGKALAEESFRLIDLDSLEDRIIHF